MSDLGATHCERCGHAYVGPFHTCVVDANGTAATASFVADYREPRPHRCPCCDGTGLVSRPPGIAGDVPSFTTGGSAVYPCRACTGTGVLWR